MGLICGLTQQTGNDGHEAGSSPQLQNPLPQQVRLQPVGLQVGAEGQGLQDGPTRG